MSKDKKTNSEHSESNKEINLRRRKEAYIWLALAFLLAGRPIFMSLKNGDGLGYKDFFDFYGEIVLAVMFSLLPLLFRQVFGELPFEYVRKSRSKQRAIEIKGSNNNIVITEDIYKQLKKKQIILNHIEESKEISQKIYSRSGAYLLIGCLIAFTGVAIFYSPIFGQVINEKRDISQVLVDYLPRFGALFFIEFIAMFFLRQYRIMMQEYRYYEGIKRERQDEFRNIQLFKKFSSDPNLLSQLHKILKLKQTRCNLKNGESTELLELEKITQKDLDIIGKFTDIVSKMKK